MAPISSICLPLFARQILKILVSPSSFAPIVISFAYRWLQCSHECNGACWRFNAPPLQQSSLMMMPRRWGSRYIGDVLQTHQESCTEKVEIFSQPFISANNQITFRPNECETQFLNTCFGASLINPFCHVSPPANDDFVHWRQQRQRYELSLTRRTLDDRTRTLARAGGRCRAHSSLCQWHP